MSDLDRIRERVRQNRVGQTATGAGAAPKPATDAARRGAQHLPGDRVFDRVTGQEGIVLGGTTENLIVPTAE
jgi:hypothetical protein